MESIGVTLFHKTVQVSSVQLNNTSSAHCLVHPLPQSVSFCPHLSPLCPYSYPHPPFPVYLYLSIDPSNFQHFFKYELLVLNNPQWENGV